MGISAMALLGVLNLPLLAEVARKYVIPTNTILVVADAVILGCAGLSFVVRPTKRVGVVILWTLIVAAWAFTTVWFGHQNLLLGAVGLRSVVVPVAAFVAGIYLFQAAPLEAVASILYRTASFWLAVMGAVAALQLILGRAHSINMIPEELGAAETWGIGDYTVGDTGIEWLFRPTSIFLHTGKFGQIAFLLATYSLFYRTATRAKGFKEFARTLGELGILAISGQRAAILCYAVALTLLNLAPMRLFRLGLWALLAWMIGGVLVERLGGEDLVEAVRLVGMRAWSGLVELPGRFQGNFLEPLWEVVKRFGVASAGAGAFSLGSAQWGGQLLYEVVTVGQAENSWLRLLAELGWVGVVLVGGGLLAMIFVGIQKLHATRAEEQGARPLESWLVKCSLYQIGMLALWANTHDVLGSMTTMAVALGYCGVLLSRVSRSQRQYRGQIQPRLEKS